MNIEKIIRFARRINYNTYIPVRIIHSNVAKFSAWLLFNTKEPPTIEIADTVSSYREIQKIILHEVGHLYSVWTWKSKSMWELEAQKWAVWRARQMGFNRLADEMRDDVAKYWTNKSEWNSNQRRYIIAAKKFLQVVK
jgi:hypothetical protein